jgi:hypothetical protein
VDLDGARDGSQGNRHAIQRIAARAGRDAIQVGGGVRTRQVAEELFTLGGARAVVGSVAVTQPDEVASWLTGFGPERIVLAFDVRLDEGGTPRLATHGWERQTQTSLWDAIERYLPAGLRHVLCTDVARDGTLQGVERAGVERMRAAFPHRLLAGEPREAQYRLAHRRYLAQHDRRIVRPWQRPERPVARHRELHAPAAGLPWRGYCAVLSLHGDRRVDVRELSIPKVHADSEKSA